ncbi:MAG: cell division protein ZapD [Gammaproteobacteria bacterium]|nr:MAG: cell division protein ZapD [Gammaproteobacteria bacterium]
MRTYEFPLNEFIRTSLKIDYLHRFLDTQCENPGEPEMRNLVSRTLELYTLIARPELKNEMIKEVEKRLKRLDNLRHIKSINHAVLRQTTARMSTAIQELRSVNASSFSAPLPHLIDSVKQRLSIPGGQFDFDLPAYKYWLTADKKRFQNEIREVISSLRPITHSAALLIELLRGSATAQTLIAENGLYQISENRNCDMLIIGLNDKLNLFPEISGGKHRVYLRFLEFNDIYNKPQQSMNTIEFELTCCFA